MIRDYLPNLSAPSNHAKDRKVIIILVDAFRADFLKSKHFTFFEKHLEDDPSRAQLFLFVADSPTMTLQRIQGIITGNLPSFINMKSNFYAEEVSNH